jgi:transposase
MKQKTYDEAFREHAVNLWLGSGKSAREVAQELGIKPDRLYVWKQQFNAAGGKQTALPAVQSQDQLQRQLERLTLENQRLRQQRDILKKTLGILSEPPNSDTNGLSS